MNERNGYTATVTGFKSTERVEAEPVADEGSVAITGVPSVGLDSPGEAPGLEVVEAVTGAESSGDVAVALATS
jgi:hypothetical protein